MDEDDQLIIFLILVWVCSIGGAAFAVLLNPVQ